MRNTTCFVPAAVGHKGQSSYSASTVTWVRVCGEWEKHNNREMVRREQARHRLNVEPPGVVDGWGDFESVFLFSAHISSRFYQYCVFVFWVFPATG